MLDGRYQIIRCLSQGAFGQIFLARDTKRPKAPICVVKQLKLNNSQPENLGKAKELFDREAETLELLGEHPQIPRLLAHSRVARTWPEKPFSIQLYHPRYIWRWTLVE